MIQSYDDGAGYSSMGGGGETVCPVCLETVFGDPDVVEAHVDACLIHAMLDAQKHVEIDVGGPSRTRVTDGVDLTGLVPPPPESQQIFRCLN